MKRSRDIKDLTFLPNKKQKVCCEQDEQDSKKYQHKDPRRHVLDLPDTYIGSVSKTRFENIWVVDENDIMVCKNVEIVPGLYKIFDEILVNAIDNVTRTKEQQLKDKNINITNRIKVTIDSDKNSISVWNNGHGMDILKHIEVGAWVPEMVFGMLRTSGNYTQNEKRIVGGKNGYGSKLTNIFSTSFDVETVDVKRQLKFYQHWECNMLQPKKQAKITSYTKSPYTKITFSPDLKRFDLTELTSDHVSLMKKRVYDIAGTSSSTHVYFNNKKVNIKNFIQYVKYFLPENIKPIVYSCDRWQVVIVPSTVHTAQHTSYVNHISTSEGGSHVNYIMNQVCKYVAQDLNVKKNHVLNNCWVFINCYIENPSFTSQIKTCLTTNVSKFGSVCELPKNILKKISKSEIGIRAVKLKEHHNSIEISKTDGKKVRTIRGIVDLEDATWAGGVKSQECTLILTEGKSAFGFAKSAIGVIGTKRYGIFPLRGKVLNPRKSTLKTIKENQEITNLKKIIGLHHGIKYNDIEERKTLRYGNVLILTDQDPDGSHIKGLLINLFDTYWPGLITAGVIKSLYTPLIVVSKNNKVVQEFYNIRDYETFLQENDISKGYKTKYYKGLATSSKKEAIACFKKNLEVTYIYDEQAKKNILNVFGKQGGKWRKEWLKKVDENMTSLDYTKSEVGISDFINKDLILYSHHVNRRAIPHIMDGFKPSQRKIIYGCLKNNQISEEKVSIVSSMISQVTSYHGGDVSMQEASIKMAQNFVAGSNNLNLLTPSGQFGTRYEGGQNKGSARYIFTKLESITKKIFKKEDDILLFQQTDEGKVIEPKFFLPIICMTLVNGAHGIGTGYSTKIPSFDPLEIIHNLKCMLKNIEGKPLVPWYKIWKGEIKQVNGKYMTYGCFQRMKNTNIVRITELPISYWTKTFIEDLKKLMEKKKIKTYQLEDKNDDENIDITVVFHEFKTDKEVIKMLKLSESSSCNTDNMMLYNIREELQLFSTIEKILETFFKIRLYYYSKRQTYKIQHLQQDVLYLKQKLRFLRLVNDGTIQFFKKTNKEIFTELKKYEIGYNPHDEKIQLTLLDENELFQLCESQDFTKMFHTPPKKLPQLKASFSVEDEKLYDYLLSIPIKNITQKEIKKLEKLTTERSCELERLKKLSPRDLWFQELYDLEQDIQRIRKEEMKERQNLLIYDTLKSKLKVCSS